MVGTLKYAGVKVKDGRVSHKQGAGPLAGATARVESVGEIDRRLSATRVVLTGGLGLFWKKKVDTRQVFLTIEGDGYSIVEEVGPKDQAAARKFAAAFNVAAKAPTLPPPPADLSHLPPPPSAEPPTTF